MRFLTHSPEETEAIGESLGRRLRGGEIIAYCGGLQRKLRIDNQQGSVIK